MSIQNISARLLNLAIKENWICYLCKLSVPYDPVKQNSAISPTREHIIPKIAWPRDENGRKQSGKAAIEHPELNVKLAHHACNNLKWEDIEIYNEDYYRTTQLVSSLIKHHKRFPNREKMIESLERTFIHVKSRRKKEKLDNRGRPQR